MQVTFVVRKDHKPIVFDAVLRMELFLDEWQVDMGDEVAFLPCEDFILFKIIEEDF